MASDVNDLTINYTEDDILKVKELDKAVLTKGAWATVMFRYKTWDAKNSRYGDDSYSIRRYQKRNGEYMPKSKFNISSRAQAEKIIEVLKTWTADQPEES